MRSSRRGFRMATLARSLLAALFAVDGTAALAQLQVDGVPTSVLRPDALVHAAPRWTEAGLHPANRSFAETNFGAAGWLGSSVQLEIPRDVVTGQYARPKVVVGLHSESMKNWMNSTGLAADHCLLPMLRARTKMTAEGDVSGTLWLYARCTFR
jgi:hypothetical protein